MSPLIVIPVHNEAATIAGIVAAARAWAPVLVVDDGSSDGSAGAARRAGAEVVCHRRRLGKGQALRTGIAGARDRGASVVVTLDGDGQHDPRDVGTLLAAHRCEPRAIVIGSRLRGDEPLPRGRLNAIRVGGFFLNWASGARIDDTQSGFRVYPIDLFEDLRPRAGGFVLETEVLLRSAALGWPIIEVDVTAISRAARPSRFRPVADGAAIGLYLARRVAGRWAVEAAAAGREVTAFARRDRRRARHAAVLAEAAPFASEPGAWALAVGAATCHRVVASLVEWWWHPRLRRARVVAGATAAAPLVLGAVALQALTRGALGDLVTPLVRAIYSQDRLAAGGGERARSTPSEGPERPGAARPPSRATSPALDDQAAASRPGGAE